MVKYHENGHIRRKWPYTTNMVIYDDNGHIRRKRSYTTKMASLTGNGSSHLGVSSGGVEVDGTVFVRASLTGNGSPSSGRQLRNCRENSTS